MTMSSEMSRWRRMGAIGVASLVALTMAASCERNEGDGESVSSAAHDHDHGDHAGHSHEGHDHGEAARDVTEHRIPTPDEPREMGPRVMDPDGAYPGLQIGDAAPSLELPTADGETVSLESLYTGGPLIVIFYDGGWRDSTVEHLKAWAARASEIENVGASVLAISPETPQRMRTTREKSGAEFTFATDPGGAAMKAFHVAFEATDAARERFDIEGVDLASWNGTADGSGNPLLPAPSTFVIDRNGVVRWTYAGWRPDDRALPMDAINAARTHR